MNDDQFDKLFKYIEEFREETNTRFDAIDKRFDSLIETLDAFAKRLDDMETEQVARDAQFSRLVEWARKVSKKTGIPMPEL